MQTKSFKDVEDKSRNTSLRPKLICQFGHPWCHLEFAIGPPWEFLNFLFYSGKNKQYSIIWVQIGKLPVVALQLWSKTIRAGSPIMQNCWLLMSRPLAYTKNIQEIKKNKILKFQIIFGKIHVQIVRTWIRIHSPKIRGFRLQQLGAKCKRRDKGRRSH